MTYLALITVDKDGMVRLVEKDLEDANHNVVGSLDGRIFVCLDWDAKMCDPVFLEKSRMTCGVRLIHQSAVLLLDFRAPRARLSRHVHNSLQS